MIKQCANIFLTIMRNEFQKKLENKIYYMPHSPVQRKNNNTTKIYIMCIASVHVPGMNSLNDLLIPRENLVVLVNVLINFRISSFAIMAEKEEDYRHAHSFLRFEVPIDELGLQSIYQK